MEEAMATKSRKAASTMSLGISGPRRQRRLIWNQRVEKPADFDWKKYYDKETQEKLLAGLEI
jgi:hypothetical protein